ASLEERTKFSRTSWPSACCACPPTSAWTRTCPSTTSPPAGGSTVSDWLAELKEVESWIGWFPGRDRERVRCCGSGGTGRRREARDPAAKGGPEGGLRDRVRCSGRPSRRPPDESSALGPRPPRRRA